MRRSGRKSNFMTVPVALKELDKIELVKLPDKRYRLDRAVTATQKAILKAFGMDTECIKRKASEISDKLR